MTIRLNELSGESKGKRVIWTSPNGSRSETSAVIVGLSDDPPGILIRFDHDHPTQHPRLARFKDVRWPTEREEDMHEARKAYLAWRERAEASGERELGNVDWPGFKAGWNRGRG